MGSYVKYEQNSKSRSIEDSLFFLLGLFSTMQLFSLFGVTIFYIILMLTFIVSIMRLFKTPYSVSSDKMLALLLISSILTTVFSLFNNVLTHAYKIESIKHFLWIGLIIWISVYLIQNDNDNIKKGAFFNGLNLSCRMQIVWAVIQIFFYYLFRVNLNNLFFNQILHLGVTESLKSEASAAITGIHWHRAGLTPVLIYYYFSTKNTLVKMALLAIAFLSNNSTSQIALLLCIFISIISTLKDKKKFTIKKKQVLIYFLVLIVLGVLVASGTVETAGMRLVQKFVHVKTGTHLDGASSITHSNYYKRLPFIIKETGLLYNLFGNGIYTSGCLFGVYYGQYLDRGTWTVESDIVGTVLERGIIGFGLLYYFLLSVYNQLLKKRNILCWVIIVNIISGVFYNLQFSWVFLIECMIYLSSRSNGNERALNNNEG